ncbi:Poly(U)-specific endoribonuclease-B [Stylophora pistillata]|uniref:Uridylate-specific endoribonuclease n=1 Tax=Stylophora pistillata TaxID=50429 RepID=A0A2B4RIX2_STYPI|nr:Poly(U)-specific endoribonuclease-B [Stylophora pistillata]
MDRKSFNPHPELSPLCQRLWDADENRLEPGIDYKIDPQGRTHYHSRDERARDPLFTFVKPEVFQRITFKRFIALLDNYESEGGQGEVVTEHEIKENQCFIDAIMETKPMKIAHEFLASKNLMPKDRGQFKRQLYKIWFQLFRRTKGVRELDSSGFEHVFVGETRNKAEVIGFHNWIQFYLQEKRGFVDYKGFFPSRRKRHVSSEEQSKNQLITIQFNWKGDVKPIGSSFIGTSPEFEMALYTVCYLAGEGKDVQVEIDDYDVTIKAHHMGPYMGSCYPQC